MTHRVLKFYENFSVDGIFDFRAIIQTGKGHVYTCQRIIYPSGEMVDWCACVGWRTRFAKNRKTFSCSHFDLFEATIETNYKGENRMSKSLVPSNIQAVNKIFGGIPLGLGINFFGEPKSLKSTGSIWLGMGEMKASGMDLLIIDSEKGLADHVLPDLLRIYNKANNTDFGIIHKKMDYRKWYKAPSTVMLYRDREVEEDLSGKDQNVVVIDVANIKAMLTFVGMPHRVEYATKIKLIPELFELFDGGDIVESPIGQILNNPKSEQEFCGFIFDSLTYLVKSFGIENQSFPPRDVAQSIIINQLGELLFEFDDMFGISITHGSRPPQDSKAKSIPLGGKSVGHGFKYQARLKIDTKQSTDLNTVIIIEPYRLPIGSLVAGQKIVINEKGVF